MKYGQFCPIAEAAEVLGDKWSLLIVRELLMGGNRFNVLQRGLGNISPTILTKRLNEMAEEGIVVKKKIQGQKGYEYFLTECGKELLPVLEQFGSWGMRWARGGMPDMDMDVELPMLKNLTIGGCWLKGMKLMPAFTIPAKTWMSTSPPPYGR